MSKTFGRFTALDNVSIKVPAGTFHALLGENGAGKSTLVKCVMGFYTPDKGTLLLDGTEVDVKNPRDAQALGVGMVYQHFTLVPSLTAAENLVASRADAPAVINWRKERERLETFLARMPFRVPLDRPVSSLAAGEKQKLEILKLLYLDQRFLILDEPTSVLTPGEADEILGLLKDMAHRGEITALMITHKFREVEAFCDDVSVLRRGAKVGGGKVGELSTREMAAMMIGDAVVRPSAARMQSAQDSQGARDRGPLCRERRRPRRGRRFRSSGPGRRDRRHRRRFRQRPEPARRGALRPAPDQARPGPGSRPGFRARSATTSTSSRCSACRRSR